MSWKRPRTPSGFIFIVIIIVIVPRIVVDVIVVVLLIVVDAVIVIVLSQTAESRCPSVMTWKRPRTTSGVATPLNPLLNENKALENYKAWLNKRYTELQVVGYPQIVGYVVG